MAWSLKKDDPAEGHYCRTFVMTEEEEMSSIHSLRSLILAAAFAALVVLTFAVPTKAETDPDSFETFAVLPAGTPGPEGLTVGPDGNVYVSTFGFTKDAAASGPGQIFVINNEGRIIRHISVVGSSPHLVGLRFNPVTGDLLVLDFPNKVAWKVDPFTGAASVFMTVTGNAFLNGLTFDKAGNAYVSDSIQGAIWKVGPRGGAGAMWVQDPLLTSSGFPPFGANGVEFNNAGDTLFVANTGNSTIVKIPVANGSAGTPSVFVNGALTADGIAIDRHDNIWVAANQADEIIVIGPSGKVLSRLGAFRGLTEEGVPRGLLFPASLAFSADGSSLFVSNLALDVRLFGLGEAVDSIWASRVNFYTVAKVATRAAKLAGD
jgi:sugar lactone lactonase YvrE